MLSVKEGVRKVKLLRVTGYGLLFLLIVFLDQASKFLVPKLGFEVVFNKGIAFGLFPDFLWVMFLPLVLLAAIVYRSKLHLSLITYHLSLIFGGGLSNLLDRLWFGAVRDWIKFPLIPTFNLADLAITLGFLLLVYHFLFQAT